MNKPKKLSPKELAAHKLRGTRTHLRIAEECSPDDVRDEQVKTAKGRLASAETELKAYEPDRTATIAPRTAVATRPTEPRPTAAKAVKQPFPPLRKGATGHERAAWANAKAQHDKENQ